MNQGILTFELSSTVNNNFRCCYSTHQTTTFKIFEIQNLKTKANFLLEMHISKQFCTDMIYCTTFTSWLNFKPVCISDI